MFDIPFVLFALANAISLIFVPIGLVTRKDGVGYIIMFTTGLFIIIFSAGTDNIVYGFNRVEISSSTFPVEQCSQSSSFVAVYNVPPEGNVYDLFADGIEITYGQLTLANNTGLQGLNITRIDFPMTIEGSTPDVNADVITVGVFDGTTGNLIQSFGTFLATDISTTYPAWEYFNFTLPSGYVVTDNDIIGVNATGTADAGIGGYYDDYSTAGLNGGYIKEFFGGTPADESVSGFDAVETVYTTETTESCVTTEITTRTYETQEDKKLLDPLLRALFVLIGTFIMLAGAFLLVRDK